jgi:hypothetical protein
MQPRGGDLFALLLTEKVYLLGEDGHRLAMEQLFDHDSLYDVKSLLLTGYSCDDRRLKVPTHRSSIRAGCYLLFDSRSPAAILTL